MGRSGVIFESGLFRDYGEESGRGAAGLVHAGFPLADGLLARSQSLRKLALGQAQMPAEGLDTSAVPVLLIGFILPVHVPILHDLV